MAKPQKRAPRRLGLAKPHGGPLATYQCRDCGAYGCLIPVPHKAAEPGRTLVPIGSLPNKPPF